MQFNSLSYLIFFAVVFTVYYLLPHKFGLRNLWLLAANYWFYMQWSVKYAVLMLFSTAVTFSAALGIDWFRKKGRKGAARLFLVLCVVLNLGILFFFKYYGFAAEISETLAERLNLPWALPMISVLLPVGISFYTFQALGYTIDVWRGTTEVVANPIRYALFVSFFPQLVAGPIERSRDLLPQFSEKHRLSGENLSAGAFAILWGLFKKMVIADRAGMVAAAVYDSYDKYSGGMYVVATLCFAVQIYCDFSAYSDIAAGSARMLGFRLTRNFRSPYQAESVAEFWRRWHVTLTSWFRDYVYIPLGGNRKGKTRKFLNVMIVFLLSGLWHGAGLTFVVWGLLNGAYQVIGELTKPGRQKINALLGNRENLGAVHLMRRIITFMLICLSWVFFRAGTITQALEMLRQMFVVPIWTLTDGSLTGIGLAVSEWVVLLLGIALLWLADRKWKGEERIEESFIRQPVLFRYACFAAFAAALMLVGVYGKTYDPQSFIYFEF